MKPVAEMGHAGLYVCRECGDRQITDDPWGEGWTYTVDWVRHLFTCRACNDAKKAEDALKASNL